MVDEASVYLEKAEGSLAGAADELGNGRYNNCANRCYYAAFLAAVSALVAAGIQPVGRAGKWGHEFVWAQFVGVLINSRKLYPAELRDTFERLYRLREVADYQPDRITAVQASRAVRRATDVVAAVRARR